ncbi:pentatricopeptide repeat-containing protein At2g20710, mitochondrial-like [Gastrolobium bilobum]|uniref:pentatricopeptide repeat-containing protein At2g20710, mitochondrial-like n=1 Tax=Gastrolobium bilobum TaxID=150636 RepID=UPI002AB004AE|nr:pentatricopeptide repeat-containing protein At2g20710, mitochondrial-like [Gastrolobium bilobum]
MNRLLDQWVEEGRDIKHPQLQFFVKQLRAYSRFNHALQVSEWMSKENLHLTTGDIAVRLDLIAKVHGLNEAEKYYGSISDTSRDFKVYGALLNCYAQHNYVEKAEAIMKKMIEYASKHPTDLVVSYNTLLKLYVRVGEYEKMDALMQEMKEKDIYDSVTFNNRLNAYVTTEDIDGMEKLLAQMEADPRVNVDWLTFSTAANGYIKAGQFEKSLAMLKKSEQLIKGNMRRVAYESLLSLYAAIGKKDDVYHIWNMCKNLNNSRNSSYICMLTALAKLDDIEGAERILEEWESGNTCFDLRIPNVIVSAYCKNGLLEKAEAYIERLEKNDKKLDGRIWDCLARGYSKCSDMDKAVQTMKKAILTGGSGWKPYPFTLAACIEHLKGKGDLELALEFLRMCMERGHFSAATYDRLLSYVNGEISEPKALDLMKGDYDLKSDEVPDGEK